MIIDCISDLHGHYPKLEGGDLLIVAGDLTARDEIDQYSEFFEWFIQQNYVHKILIAGNHDNQILDGLDFSFDDARIFYLEDSGIEINGLKIWGSPWTKRFEGMNPKAMAFTVDTEEELAEKWKLIPDDTDILVTHSPAYGVLDEVYRYTKDPRHRLIQHVGSGTLSDKMAQLRPKLHTFGHIHERGGNQMQYGSNTICINASHVNERYEPVNKPVRVIL